MDGREGILSIRIADRDHIIHYPSTGNADLHIRNILDGNVYRPLRYVKFTPTTIIDVGANVGASAAFFLSLYPDCRIYCFEPHTGNFQYLKRNLSGFDKVTLRPIGLYDSDQETTLLYGAAQCLQHSIFPSAEVTGHGETIQLKDAMDELQSIVDSATLLKIDTEGCELSILKRIETLLVSIKVIYLEFHNESDRVEVDRLLRPTHGLWSCKMNYVHRGDLCYVHRTLWEEELDIQKWIIKRAK